MRRIYGDYAATGSAGGLLESLTDDVSLTLTIPAGTPISGTFRGKEAVMGYFRTLREVVEQLTVEVHDYLAGEDKVVVLGAESLRVRRTGEAFSTAWASVYSFRWDRIKSVLVIKDLSAVSKAYLDPDPPPSPHNPLSTPAG
ncbi:Hypothetical protein CAP_8316 [Chondromyces apiculatus DSM 436]|uniref:SnoaL-like domain-containing protein n=1 Tax=Chondromyces apiculatus DSM 436 TaxID=1192034 RepID=A0A017SXN3_9BACT|nr:Hypothetical protein CAP_8316 [Chondromyces apiculatus DSM 436]